VTSAFFAAAATHAVVACHLLLYREEPADVTMLGSGVQEPAAKPPASPAGKLAEMSEL
jgi:hypothetical protein